MVLLVRVMALGGAMLAGLATPGLASPTGAPQARPNAHASGGCGSTPPVSTGVTTERTIQVAGLTRSYRLRVPASYDENVPLPLVVSHHGWTCSASEDEHDGGMSLVAEKDGVIVAYLNGWDDNSHDSGGGFGWKSWNGAGTVYSDEKRPGCYKWGGTSQYCYTSCAERSHVRHDGHEFTGCDPTGCDWTTCVSSDSFNVAVLDLLESELCVDTTREYATGQSNGAIYTFHLGVTLSSRLAAIVPISGSMMHGYIAAPSVAMPVLDCTGTLDRTVPINDTLFGRGAVSYEGWIYSTMDDIFAQWEPANGCTDAEAAQHWPTSLDGVQDLYCWGKRCGASGESPVIRCAWRGGHNYFGNEGALNSRLVWEFMSQFSRPSHRGLGRTNSSLAPGVVHTAPRAAAAREPATGVRAARSPPVIARTLRGSEPTSASATAVGRMAPAEASAADEQNHGGPSRGDQSQANQTTARGRQSAYGNPKYGCLAGESVLAFSNGKIDGRVCAPAKAKGECKVGGYRTAHNGCPAYTGGLLPRKGIFPTCLAVPPEQTADQRTADQRTADEETAAEREHFHCTLTCDRAQSTNSHDPEADANCPAGAVCLTGQLRLAHVGVCVYPR